MIENGSLSFEGPYESSPAKLVSTVETLPGAWITVSSVEAFPLLSVGPAEAVWEPRVKSSSFQGTPTGAPLTSSSVPESVTGSEYCTLEAPVAPVYVVFVGIGPSRTAIGAVSPVGSTTSDPPSAPASL